ncbi:ParH-like protein [Streptomyces camelliae]|uniref:ParH-like protein n=1 Tax=Streptomyces camelliae TaxID=3004093 RepID=A0ABY7PDI8_9ACTN|nr:ParH-like protein [Streptomyces sp. HUAS 2-6]WBO68678.1 ParH-like protein [Streptomyces sp. HUAS 2-6]
MWTDRRRGALTKRHRRRVQALSLPRPFDAAVFIAALAAERGRPIDLVPVAGRTDTPCGLLVTTDRADCIVYAADTTALHQQHILLHEAAHLICGHHEAPPSLSPAARVLLPNLPPSLVERVLGRTVYTEPQEREAELVASLIRCRAAREDSLTAASEVPDGSRLATLLTAPHGRAASG